jgi:mRNA interferase YafQ
MWTIEKTGDFKRDYKRAQRRGCDLDILASVIDDLAAGRPLAAHHCDHRLKGKYKDRRECHVTGDWLLVYLIDRRAGELWLINTGTHSDLFG